MKLWWVHFEEYESGEAYSIRNTRCLVYAATGERAIEIVLMQDIPNWLDEGSFDRPTATLFQMPTMEGVVK